MAYVNEQATAGGLSNWLDAQMGVKITLQDGTTKELNNYIRMSVNRNANYNVYHSVGKHNRGYIKLPRAYSFTITVPVTSPDVQIFRMLFNGEVIFAFNYYDLKGSSINTATGSAANLSEFKLKEERLNGCIVNTFNDSYEVEGIPMAVFNGTALDNNFIATVDGGEFLEQYVFGDNSTKLTVANLEDLVDDEYWDLSPTV